MDCLSLNDRHYLVTKYWPFILNHLVCVCVCVCVCICLFLCAFACIYAHARKCVLTHRHIRNESRETYNIFSHNDRYSHLLNYWPFLLNHPVFLLGEFSISDLRAHVSLECEFPMRDDKLISLFQILPSEVPTTEPIFFCCKRHPLIFRRNQFAVTSYIFAMFVNWLMFVILVRISEFVCHMNRCPALRCVLHWAIPL